MSRTALLPSMIDRQTDDAAPDPTPRQGRSADHRIAPGLTNRFLNRVELPDPGSIDHQRQQ